MLLSLLANRRPPHDAHLHHEVLGNVIHQATPRCQHETLLPASGQLLFLVCTHLTMRILITDWSISSC
jgi:hypothetical protein